MHECFCMSFHIFLVTSLEVGIVIIPTFPVRGPRRDRWNTVSPPSVGATSTVGWICRCRVCGTEYPLFYPILCKGFENFGTNEVPETNSRGYQGTTILCSRSHSLKVELESSSHSACLQSPNFWPLHGTTFKWLWTHLPLSLGNERNPAAL